MTTYNQQKHTLAACRIMGIILIAMSSAAIVMAHYEHINQGMPIAALVLAIASLVWLRSLEEQLEARKQHRIAEYYERIYKSRGR